MTYTLFTEDPVRRVFLCVIVMNSRETKWMPPIQFRIASMRSA